MRGVTLLGELPLGGVLQILQFHKDDSQAVCDFVDMMSGWRSIPDIKPTERYCFPRGKS